jgi:hypothetical protein
VSADSGNYSKLGTDKLIYTPTPTAYTLPTASSTVLGGVKVGAGLTIAAGVLAANATSVSGATTTTAGTVTLADAAAIAAGTVGRIPDASQLKGQVDPKAPTANPTFTGVVQIPSGTVANPSVAFTGDADTGVFAPSANSVGIAAGGVSALEVTATGATVAGTLTAGGLTYPTTKGTKDQVLSSDGAGNVAWQTVTAGSSYTLPTATPLILGGVKVADAAAITTGAAGYVVDAAQLKAAAYTLPDATASTLGGVTLADAAAITAGTAGKIVDAAQLKATADLHVKKSGDTMTGVLKVHTSAAVAAPGGGVTIVGEAYHAAMALHRFNDTAAAAPIYRLYRMRGTEAAPATLHSGDGLGQFVFSTKRTDGAVAIAASISSYCDNTVTVGDVNVTSTLEFSVRNDKAADRFFIARVAPNGFGIQTLSPSSTLDVMGTSALRGNVNIVGNITSSGTAHNFAAASIPASAISGLTSSAIPKKTPASQTATGTEGEFCWDADYLYGAIAANQWRRIPWTDWHGNTLPGSGAGATDTALPADFTSSSAQIAAGGLTPNGKIVMQLGTTVPPLAIGVKIQYRIHGGNWVDATNAGYWVSSGGYTSKPSFQDMKATAGTVTRLVIINGPTPGTPYITRMAWVSSLGVGLWTSEYTAVTPTA